jgi:hypothetical protein
MSEKSLTLRLALLVAIVFVSAAPVFSQAFYGSIAGTITDHSNKNVFAARNYQIGGGIAKRSATYYEGVPANSALDNLVNMTPVPGSISEFRAPAELTTATGQTTRLDGNLKVGMVRTTVKVAAQASEIQTNRDATAAQVINDVTNVIQNPFCAMLQNGVQPSSDMSTSTLGDR